MALVCIRHLEYRIAIQYQKLSAEVIRNELVHVQATILKDYKTKLKYAIPSKSTKQAIKIYQSMGENLSDVPYQLNWLK